ncbi:hypothetical protein [Xanthobacter pseudotagetidis]|uniref:hypothetical protein n=1 Tax=Xanthobacter pseudotagetidis TaxID=3119911 RepID=UPI00372C5DBA
MTKTILMLGAALMLTGAGAAHAAGVGSHAGGPVPAALMTRSLDCAQAAQAVRQMGAVRLATSALDRDIYVSSNAYCAYDQDLRPEWVPTRDTSRCFVGYTCADQYRDSGDGQ